MRAARKAARAAKKLGHKFLHGALVIVGAEIDTAADMALTDHLMPPAKARKRRKRKRVRK
jgi:hypothetical protein